MLFPAKCPFDKEAPLWGQELLHANNLPFLLPTRMSFLLIVKTCKESSFTSSLLQILIITNRKVTDQGTINLFTKLYCTFDTVESI